MKQTLCLCLALALLLCFAACNRNTNTEPESSTPSAAPETTQPAEPETEPSTEPSTESTAQNVEDYVTVLESQQITYDDELSNHYDISIVIPVLTLDSPAAQDANDAIQSACLPKLDELNEAKETGCSAFVDSIGYDAWLNENLLTLLVDIEYMTDYRDYMLYVFDLSTGNLMTNNDMAALLRIDRDTLDMQITAAMESKFLSMFEGMLDQEFTRQQLDSTCSVDNIALAQVYLDESGSPYVLCTIYSIAGAESYEYLLPLGE